MPTSHLNRRLEVRFPAEFTAEYMAPLSYFPGVSSVPSGMCGGAQFGLGMYAPSYPANDGFANDNQIWHKQKMMDRAAQVATQVRNLQIQRINQATYMPYQVMAGGCDECYGGARYGGTPTTIEGAQVLSGRGLRGGVMRTLAGRKHIEARLSARIGELNRIDAEAAGEQYNLPQVAPEPNTEDYVRRIQDSLDGLDDTFTANAFDSDSPGFARNLLKSLLDDGWRLPSNIITPILRQVVEMLSTIEQMIGATNPQFLLSAERKRRARLIFQVLERCQSVLQELSRVSDLSPQERQMALGALRPELVGQVAQQQARSAPRQNARRQAQPPPPPEPRRPSGRVQQIMERRRR